MWVLHEGLRVTCHGVCQLLRAMFHMQHVCSRPEPPGGRNAVIPASVASSPCVLNHPRPRFAHIEAATVTGDGLPQGRSTRGVRCDRAARTPTCQTCDAVNLGCPTHVYMPQRSKTRNKKDSGRGPRAACASGCLHVKMHVPGLWGRESRHFLRRHAIGRISHLSEDWRRDHVALLVLTSRRRPFLVTLHSTFLTLQVWGQVTRRALVFLSPWWARSRAGRLRPGGAQDSVKWAPRHPRRG